METLKALVVDVAAATGRGIERMVMGAPVTTKETHGPHTNERLVYAVSGMQGYRESMEDAHVHLLSLTEQWPSLSLFAVFDGHGGDAVSMQLARDFPPLVLRHWQASAQEAGLRDDAHVAAEPGRVEPCARRAFEHAFLAADALFERERFAHCGSTGVVVLIASHHIICANAGDSRATLSRGGQAVDLSTDHKPMLPTELARIEAAGSRVKNRRVDADLAVSRGFGDKAYKNPGLPAEQQAVTVVPEVTVSPRRQAEDEFVILACDGVWDVMTSQAAVDFVRTCLVRGPPKRIGRQLEWPSERGLGRRGSRCNGSADSDGAGPATADASALRRTGSMTGRLARGGSSGSRRRSSLSSLGSANALRPFDVGAICELLLDHCLRLGSHDNMSAVIVLLRTDLATHCRAVTSRDIRPLSGESWAQH